MVFSILIGVNRVEQFKIEYASKRILVNDFWKVHYFLNGRKFILQTDQKPIVSISRKHMIEVSLRVQRIAFQAWQYGFEPHYISGNENVISDALLRLTPLQEFQGPETEKEILAVNVLQYSLTER